MKKLTPFLFIHNQFSPYTKSKDVASDRTMKRKAERTHGRLFWDSSRKGTYVRPEETIIKPQTTQP